MREAARRATCISACRWDRMQSSRRKTPLTRSAVAMTAGSEDQEVAFFIVILVRVELLLGVCVRLLLVPSTSDHAAAWRELGRHEHASFFFRGLAVVCRQQGVLICILARNALRPDKWIRWRTADARCPSRRSAQTRRLLAVQKHRPDTHVAAWKWKRRGGSGRSRRRP